MTPLKSLLLSLCLLTLLAACGGDDPTETLPPVTPPDEEEPIIPPGDDESMTEIGIRPNFHQIQVKTLSRVPNAPRPADAKMPRGAKFSEAKKGERLSSSAEAFRRRLQ